MDERRRDHIFSPFISKALIYLGSSSPLLDCEVVNISAGGARIVCTSQMLPARFFLFLTPNGSDKRYCQVVWRDGNNVGVTFESS
jgi:hypothetical protein